MADCSNANTEIELKYILPRRLLSRLLDSGGVSVSRIRQLYLHEDTARSFANQVSLPEDVEYSEWRVRQKDNQYFFTAKGAYSPEGLERPEYECRIDEGIFAAIADAETRLRKCYEIKKTRYSYSLFYRDGRVLVDIDDYCAEGTDVQLDFIVCELETTTRSLASQLRQAGKRPQELAFLAEGYDVTGLREFSNRYIAEKSFVADTLLEIASWLHGRHQDTSAVSD